MVNIDAIMALLDWNNSAEQQERGIELAKNVKCINVFLQPNQREYGKNVWDNCAKILKVEYRAISIPGGSHALAAGYELAGSVLHTGKAKKNGARSAFSERIYSLSEMR